MSLFFRIIVKVFLCSSKLIVIRLPAFSKKVGNSMGNVLGKGLGVDCCRAYSWYAGPLNFSGSSFERRFARVRSVEPSCTLGRPGVQLKCETEKVMILKPRVKH